LAELYIARADEKMFYAGDMTGSRSWAEKALALAEKINDSEIIADSYMTLGYACLGTGDQKKAYECFERALKIALDKNYVDVALRAYHRLALEPSLKIEKFIEYFEKRMELSKKAGFIGSIAFSGCALAFSYAVYRGNMKDAVPLAEESVALSRKVGHPSTLCLSIGFLGVIRMILGELDKSEQYLREAFSFSQIAGDLETVAWGHLYPGLLHFEKGEYNKAREHFEMANEIFEKVFTVQYIGSFLASQYLIWTYIELGEIDKAQSLVNNLHKIALDVRDEDLIANLHALTAMVFRAQKKWKESIEHFEKSLQKHEALNARQWDVYWFAKMVLCEYARMYLERNEEGDREKAHSLLNQALEIFQKMGAKKEIERTMKTLEALHHPITQTSEETISPRSYELAEVQSNITATPRELKVGESLELEIEVTNTRKEGVILLTKITEVIPEGFAIAKKPEFYRVEGNCLNMREKRLDPLKTEEVKLVLTPKIKGTFHIKPKIVYLDENGEEKSFEPKPVSITVRELGIKGWLKGES